MCDLGQCSVIPPDGRKQLLPPLGRRDFCRPAKLSPLQGAEVDGYGVGATLWVTWQGQYDGSNRIDRAWNKHEERDALQQRLERLAARALAQFGAPNVTPPRWPFASTLLKHLRKTTLQVRSVAWHDRVSGHRLPEGEQRRQEGGCGASFSADFHDIYRRDAVSLCVALSRPRRGSGD